MSLPKPLLSLNQTGVWINYKRYSSPSANTQFVSGASVDSIDYFKDVIEDPETYDGTVVVPINSKTVARFNWLSHNWLELRVAFAQGVLELRTMQARVGRRADGTAIWRKINWPLDVTALYDLESTKTPLYTVVFYDQTPRALSSTTATIFKEIPDELKLLTRKSHQRDGYKDDLFPGVFWFQGYYTARASKLTYALPTTKFAFAAMTVPHELIDKIRVLAAPGTKYRVLPVDRCLDVDVAPEHTNKLYPNPLTAKLRWHDLAPAREPFQHAWLVGLVLCFHKLPPYVILEIYDWLPVARAMSHKRKIELIYAAQKSIRKAIGVREFRIGVEQHDNS